MRSFTSIITLAIAVVAIASPVPQLNVEGLDPALFGSLLGGNKLRREAQEVPVPGEIPEPSIPIEIPVPSDVISF